MDGTPGALRIETGEHATIQQPQPTQWPAWAAPALAGGAVFAGLTVTALGILWLRHRPVREATQDELFQHVAKALGLSEQQRAAVLAQASPERSATGIAMWK